MQFAFLQKFCASSTSGFPGFHSTSHNSVVITSESVQAVQEVALLDTAKNTENEVNAESSNGRVMLIDGTSVIYRAYYKLLGMFFI